MARNAWLALPLLAVCCSMVAYADVNPVDRGDAAEAENSGATPEDVRHVEVQDEALHSDAGEQALAEGQADIPVAVEEAVASAEVDIKELARVLLASVPSSDAGDVEVPAAAQQAQDLGFSFLQPHRMPDVSSSELRRLEKDATRCAVQEPGALTAARYSPGGVQCRRTLQEVALAQGAKEVQDKRSAPRARPTRSITAVQSHVDDKYEAYFEQSMLHGAPTLLPAVRTNSGAEHLPDDDARHLWSCAAGSARDRSQEVTEELSRRRLDAALQLLDDAAGAVAEGLPEMPKLRGLIAGDIDADALVDELADQIEVDAALDTPLPATMPPVPLSSCDRDLDDPLRAPAAATNDLLRRLSVLPAMTFTEGLRGMSEAAREQRMQAVASLNDELPLVHAYVDTGYGDAGVAASVAEHGFARLLVCASGEFEARIVAHGEIPWLGNATLLPSAREDDVPGVQMAKLSPSQVLYVPAGAAVAWWPTFGDGAVHSVLLEHRIVDAANWNRAVAALRVEAAASERSDALLRALRAPQLDLTMVRIPGSHRQRDLALPWPRAGVADSDPDAADPAAAYARRLKEQPAGEAPGSAPGKEAAAGEKRSAFAARRRRARGGAEPTGNGAGGAAAGPTSKGGRLKQWQDDQRWKWRMLQLMMPAPESPKVDSFSFREATIRFTVPLREVGGVGPGAVATQDSQLSADAGDALIGYSVVYSAVGISDGHHDMGEGGELEGVLHAHAHDADGSEDTDEAHDIVAQSLAGFDVAGSVLAAYDHRGVAQSTGAHVVPVIVGCGGRLTDQLCITVPNLQPGHTYTFRVAAMTAEGNSTYSDPSPPINTPVMVVPKPPTGVRVTALHMTHAHLSWKVEDDGGADMLAYVVLRQRDEHGDYVEGVLCNTVDKECAVGGLLPGSSYKFRVAAVNSVGVSEPSQATPTTRTPQEPTADGGAPRRVHGVGARSADAHSLQDALPGQYIDPSVRSRARKIVEANLPSLHLGHLVPPSFGRPGSGMEPPPLPAHLWSDGVVDALVSDDRPAAARLNVPCLGPVITINDADQSVSIETQLPNVPSKLRAWTSHFSPRQYTTTAELVRAEPGDGARHPLWNADAVRQRIAFFDRGGVSLRDKVWRAAHAGAVGVVIADTYGRCPCGQPFTQSCVPGADQRHGEYWAMTDLPDLWRGARIPAVLLCEGDAALLRKHLA